VHELRSGPILKAALIAGLLAGLVTAVFHFAVTEAVIDNAIALELAHRAGDEHADPIVSRATQRVGLFVGFLLYGLTWSLLFGAVYHLAQRRLPASGVLRRGLVLAAAGYWAVALLPALKYPANPPGVGEPETIGYRQALYLAMLALSVASTAVALVLARADGRGWPRALGVLAVSAVALYLLLPANPDPVTLPADLVGQFRLLSIAGLTIFWLVLGLTFGLLLGRHSTGVALRPSARAI
jgi:predicted cobalt transporter CbtA